MKTALLLFKDVRATAALLVLVSLLAGGTSLRGANLLVNGGFEDISITGSTASYDSTTTPVGFGWTVSGTVGVFNSGVGHPPIVGAQSISLAEVGAGVTQTVPVTPGVAYTLRWLAGSLVEGVAYRFSVRIQGARLIYLKEYSGTNGTATLQPDGVSFITSSTTSVVRITFQRTLASATAMALDEIVLAEDAPVFPDFDQDGHPDPLDPCRVSDLRATIFVGTANSGVPNRYGGALVDGNGCSLADHIHAALIEAAISSRVANRPDRVNRSKFNRAMRDYLNDLELAGLLTNQQRDDIMDAVRAVDGAQFLP